MWDTLTFAMSVILSDRRAVCPQRPTQMARIRLLRALCSTSARPSTSSTGGT